MAKVNLTDRLLKSLKPNPDGKPFDRMDSVVPGLGARVLGTIEQPIITFILVTRYFDSANPARRARHPARRALGTYGALTLQDARAKARRWLELIAGGIDPKSERQAQENLFGEVAEAFCTHIAKHRRGAKAAQAIRRELISRWGKRPIGSITKADVIEVIDAIKARGALGSAHATFSDCRRLFNWAIGSGRYGIEHSPCDRLRPTALIGKKNHRKRTPDSGEVAAFMRATEEIGYPYGPLFMVLLLCGLRLNEAAKAKWSEFDFARRRWTIPGERMKAGLPHIVPLADDTIKLLQGLPRFKAPHVFSTTFGRTPVTGFGRAKAKLDAAMRRELGDAFTDFVTHDLRRVVKSGMAELKVPDHVSELVLAHTKPGLHKVYDQFEYLDERREALARWADKLRRLREPNVIALTA